MMGSIKLIFLEEGINNVFVLMILFILFGSSILICISRYIERNNAIQLLKKESIWYYIVVNYVIKLWGIINDSI